MVKADVQYMFNRPEKPVLVSLKFNNHVWGTELFPDTSPFSQLSCNFFQGSIDSHYIFQHCQRSLKLPALSPSMSPWDARPVYIYLSGCPHWGKLIRYQEQVQRYVNRKCFTGYTLVIYAQLSHKHCTCALSSKLKTKSITSSLLINFFSILNIRDQKYD